MLSHLAVLQRKRLVTGPTLIQQKAETDIRGTLTVSLDAPVTPGNLVVVCVSYVPTANSVTDVNDGDVFIHQVQSRGTGIGADIWTTIDTAGATDIDITQTSGVLRLSANVSEWSAVASGTAENGNDATGVASTTVTTGSVTPLSAKNLVIAVGGWTADDYSSGPTNSFTRMTPAGGGAIWQEAAYKIQSSAIAKSTGWTLTAGINWAAGVAVFGGN